MTTICSLALQWCALRRVVPISSVRHIRASRVDLEVVAALRLAVAAGLRRRATEAIQASIAYRIIHRDKVPIYPPAQSHRMRTGGALALRYLSSGVPIAPMGMADARPRLSAFDLELPRRHAQLPRPRSLPVPDLLLLVRYTPNEGLRGTARPRVALNARSAREVASGGTALNYLSKCNTKMVTLLSVLEIRETHASCAKINDTTILGVVRHESCVSRINSQYVFLVSDFPVVKGSWNGMTILITVTSNEALNASFLSSIPISGE
eukprot:6213861-Pleurochrysis_carterae.AAC.2